MKSSYTDHLGSIVALTDGTGAVVHRQAFDAWGRRRNATSWATDDRLAPPATFQWLRGYTGHEHLDSFGLINMNARLYDPKLGRMLSVDNYVSAPGTALGYNRYAYAMNNPVMYTDPSGNFFWSVFTAVWDFWATGFSGGFDVTKGWERMSQSWAKYDPTRPGSKTNNAFAIDFGMYKYDENRTFFGRVWQVAERFITTSSIINAFGNLTGHVENLNDRVKSVHYFHGATVMEVPDLGPLGQARGSFIRVRQYDGLKYEPGTNDLTSWSSVLVHEYGHYLQSSRFGFWGNVVGAINSGDHPNGNGTDPDAWFEKDADWRGAAYFGRMGYSLQGYSYANRPHWPLVGAQILGGFANPFTLFWINP